MATLVIFFFSSGRGTVITATSSLSFSVPRKQREELLLTQFSSSGMGRSPRRRRRQSFMILCLQPARVGWSGKNFDPTYEDNKAG